MDDGPRELTVTVKITDGGLVLPAELVEAAGLTRGGRLTPVNDGKLLVSPWPHGYDGEEPEDAEPPYYSEEEMRRLNDDLERNGPDVAAWVEGELNDADLEDEAERLMSQGMTWEEAKARVLAALDSTPHADDSAPRGGREAAE